MSYSIPSFGKGTICSSEALGLTEGGSGQEGIVCRENSRGSDGLQPHLCTRPPSKSRRVPCLQASVSPL